MSGMTENVEVGFSKMIEKHLEKYFALHNGENIPPGLYGRVLTEVERTLFSMTLKYSQGNQLRAAQILGINRNTLRRKMENGRK
ncbi:MAG: Fis family transcriptional regulator [Holosporaceae bacterium]|jgi:two-component system nitrogen regulation response regulator GlnG|nr:Fis family transcriptional regulator [Holosporaceae bacterium]